MIATVGTSKEGNVGARMAAGTAKEPSREQKCCDQPFPAQIWTTASQGGGGDMSNSAPYFSPEARRARSKMRTQVGDHR